MGSKYKLGHSLKIVVLIMLCSLPFLAEPVWSFDKLVVIGTEMDYPPYSFQDENGQAAGYNVDLINALAQIMHFKVEIRIAPWGEIRNALENGEIDAIAGMYYSEERDKVVDFTPEFTSIHHAIFVHPDSPTITKEADLRGKAIIVMQGDIMHDYVLEKGLSNNPKTVATQAEAVRLLAQGQYDCALIAQLTGLFWVKELGLPGIETTGPPLHLSQYCFAVQEGDSELQGELTEGLSTLAGIAQEKEIYDKWLGVLKPQGIPRSKVIQYSAAIIVPVLLLLVFFALRATFLKRQVAARTRDLQERAKELQCIYNVAESILKQETIEELLHDVVKLIPAGWQYPDITLVRIFFDSRSYCSAQFTMSKWSQSREIMIEGQRRGSLEVYYTEQRPELEEGPFLLSERQLIDALCGLLGQSIQSKLVAGQFLVKKAKYQALFEKMLNGFAVHDIICDREGKPIDYRFLDVNPAFEQMTGLKKNRAIGKTLLEILPNSEPYWIEKYGQVALTGDPIFFEQYSRELDKTFEVSAFQSGPNQFACIFADITERKKYQASLANHRTRLQSLASRLANAEDLLRQDIAAGLHDSIGQDLAALKLSVDIMRQGSEGTDNLSQDNTRTNLDLISQSLDEIVKKIWTLAFQLSPPGLFESGLQSALEWLILDFNSKHEINFRLVVLEPAMDLDKQARGLLFQVVRECVVNAVKHGQPTEIQVILSREDESFVATVVDDGRGFDVQDAMATTEFSTGFGLFSIRERLAFQSGKLEVESVQGEGSRVKIFFPLEDNVMDKLET